MNGNLPAKTTSGAAVDIQQILKLQLEIHRRLDFELRGKQDTIVVLERELERLHLLLDAEGRFKSESDEKLALLERENEGHKQLINKLLGDIEGLNKDLSWYKRTYEKRTVPGILLDRARRLFSRQKAESISK